MFWVAVKELSSSYHVIWIYIYIVNNMVLELWQLDWTSSIAKPMDPIILNASVLGHWAVVLGTLEVQLPEPQRYVE